MEAGAGQEEDICISQIIAVTIPNVHTLKVCIRTLVTVVESDDIINRKALGEYIISNT